jgi:transcription-repair coupling factor (superfamily II helicase)
VTEVALGATGLRFSPVDLPESGRLRLSRLYRGSAYREASRTVTLRPPTESDTIGSPLLRDAELLEFCRTVLAQVVPVPVGG